CPITLEPLSGRPVPTGAVLVSPAAPKENVTPAAPQEKVTPAAEHERAGTPQEHATESQLASPALTATSEPEPAAASAAESAE
ncbi:MAG: hypothetical protein ACLQVF_17805, partial [Isosphaeraceae bacterium]